MGGTRLELKLEGCMNIVRSISALVFLSLGVTACGPAAPSGGGQSGGRSEPGATMPQRTLAIIVRGEMPSLAAKPLVGFSGSLDAPRRIFNATLDFVDEKEVARPYLVEALPQLNTDTWRVFPDGRMETVHRLRPNLTWHDGAPLSAEDFVFALKVYSTPEFGVAGQKPNSQMEEIVAPDARTVVIKWQKPFAEADQMDVGFQALPRHILEQPFQAASGGDAQAFVNHPFWTVDYVGLGPYALKRWEAGAFLEATAFDGHALGRPKIDRLRVLAMADANTALANMLSGDGHYIGDFVLGYDEGLTLEREWPTRGGGTVFFAPVLIRLSQVQHRPEYVKPKALLDVRVRRALAYAFDVPGALEVFTGGRGVPTWTLTSPRADYYAAVERLITKRPYDPLMTQRLLEEAGFRRGPDGVYASPAGERLEVEIWTTGGPVFGRENRIFADSVRQAGIDTSPQELGPARLADAQYRALISGLFTGGAGDLDRRLAQHSIQDIARPETRWQGNNRGAWANEEYERLWQAYNATLGRENRVQQIAQMEQLLNEDVGTIPHYFSVVVTAHGSNLKGPVARMTPDAPVAIYQIWTWEWRS